MYRSAILRQTRYLSTSTRFQKSAVEVGKDAVKKVDRVVSDTLVGAIETGETVVQKTKETVGSDASEVKANAKQAMGEAKGKASELTGEAKGKSNELSGKANAAGKTDTNQIMGEAKGKASELAGQAKGKASELSGKAKGTAEEVKAKV